MTDHFRVSVVNIVNVYVSFALALGRAGALFADSCHNGLFVTG